jgi:CRISPR-associated endonuclease/helicase Cas3
MFTDAAPIDSLIQRFGRINRKRTKDTVAQKLLKDIHILAPPESAKDILPYQKEIVVASFEQFENGEVVKEKLIQTKIDNVYPTIDLTSIKTKIVWDGDHFLLKKLNHNPKAVLMETLNIESATAILYSDSEKYNNSKSDDRIPLEIPIPRSTRFKKFTNFGYSSVGAKPVIIHDDLYTYERGLIFKEIDNFL